MLTLTARKNQELLVVQNISQDIYPDRVLDLSLGNICAIFKASVDQSLLVIIQKGCESSLIDRSICDHCRNLIN